MFGSIFFLIDHSTRALYMRARYEFESRDLHGFSAKAEILSGEEEDHARHRDTLAEVNDLYVGII